MMSSSLAAILGLAIAIFLIIKKVSPVYSLILGALIGGVLGSGSLVETVGDMFDGVKSITPAVLRIIAAGVLPALVGLLVTVFLIVPLLRSKKDVCSFEDSGSEKRNKSLPSFWASMAGPLFAVLVLALRPICGIVIDPLVALPLGGLVTLLATCSIKSIRESLDYGLSKMAPVAVLLIGTGTLAGVISASDMKDVVIDWLGSWNVSGTLMAPLSGALMCAATASTTAGATIASASFADAISATGLAGVWGAALTNSGATVLDHLPHGSFFHATAGSVYMPFKERLSLIPYESMVGLTLSLSTILCSLLFG